MKGAQWIWPGEADGVNQSVEFRHEFELPEDFSGEASLHITADSQYTVWLNGTLIGTGQYTGFPDEAYFNTYAVSNALMAGRNVLAVEAYCCGVEHFSYIVSGRPGAIYRLETTTGTALAESGADGTQTRPCPTYRSGEMPRITNQLPFTFEYDATRAENWKQPDYTPGKDWRPIGKDDCLPGCQGRKLSPLPIAHWNVHDRVPAHVIAQGLFKPGVSEETARSVGEQMQKAFLASREPRDLFQEPPEAPISLRDLEGGLAIRPGIENAYVVLDLGREESGFLEIELSANAETLVDIGYGQHLTSLRVRTEVGGRNFASRYRCKEGRQTFTHWKTRASGRYLQLHLHGDVASVLLYYAGLRPATWPVEMRGHYATPDRLDARIWEVSARTLQLCMREHYEDTPWREQGLYANDSLIQALCGYYAFGEYAFPAFSFDLLGKGLQSDGWLELCAPARIPITIPAFSASWIIALSDHFLHSANYEAAAKNFPVVKKLLEGWIKGMEDDLLPSPGGNRFWHFYDWTPHLSGCSPDGLQFQTLNELRFDAPLNAFFILALDSGALLAENLEQPEWVTRWRETASRVRGTFQRQFWSAEKSCYNTFSSPVPHDQREYSELVQALAICAGIPPTAHDASELAKLLATSENGLVRSTLSQSLFTLQALAPDPTYRKDILDRIRKRWGDMMLQGATACWETSNGPWDFDQAGSLCHGWSALPTYAFGAWVLGVRPLQPGFREFSVDPDLALAPGTSGRIPTPFGTITIAHQRSAKEILTTELSHPPETSPVFSR